MEDHVLDALRAVGSTVDYASTAIRLEALGSVANAFLGKLNHSMLREPERLLEPRLVKRAERFAPDLVLVLQGNHISPKTVAQLRQRTKARIVCWCQDHLGVLGRQYLLGAEYDAVFVKDRYMLELFSNMIKGTPFFYLPEACNPRVHRSLELTAEDRRRYECDVMIYGSIYYYRQAILQQLGEFDLKIWGHAARWFVNRVEGAVSGPEVFLDHKVRAVRAARIALNPLHYGEVNALNCRTFELAGCGAFQLVTHKPVLKEHFIPGNELDDFRSTDELIEKIRHYLNYPEQAAAIAKRGQERAHREHTYEHRLRDIVRVALGRQKSSSPRLRHLGGARSPA
jgi:spore maturation protein CgeB